MTDLEKVICEWVKTLQLDALNSTQKRVLHHLKNRAMVENGKRWIESQKLGLESNPDALQGVLE